MGVSASILRTTDQSSRRERGSTPTVGSSRSKRSGIRSSALASASFCFMPPESFPAWRSSNPASPVMLRSSAMRRLRPEAPSASPSNPRRPAKTSRFSRHESVLYSPSVCGMKAMRVVKSSLSGSGVVPRTERRPSSGASRPQRSRMKVDLPAPSGPTNAMSRSEALAPPALRLMPSTARIGRAASRGLGKVLTTPSRWIAGAEAIVMARPCSKGPGNRFEPRLAARSPPSRAGPDGAYFPDPQA